MIHTLLLDSHITFPNPKKVLPLKPKFIIMGNNKNEPFKTYLPWRLQNMQHVDLSFIVEAMMQNLQEAKAIIMLFK